MVSATELTTATEVAIEVAATTTVAAPGVPTTSQSYVDAVEAADKFSKTGLQILDLLAWGGCSKRLM